MATHTYQTLVEELGLHPRSIARRLFNELPAPDWSIQPPEYNDLVTPSTANSSKELLARISLSHQKTYSLSVIDNQVVVMHELAECPELAARGGRYVALAGDFRPVASNFIPPGYMELPGTTSRTTAARRFTTQAVPVQEWAAIQTQLAGDGDLELATRAVAPADGEAIPSTAVHWVLPVPPHIAVCFLTRTPVRAAFLRGHAIRELIPEPNRENYAPLFNFLRAAVTRSENDADRSAMQSQWAPVTMAQGSALETRWYTVWGRLEAPVLPPAPTGGGAPPPPPPAPEPETEAAAEKSAWEDFHLRKIFTVAGKKKADLPTLTESALPDVFQGLKKHRGSNVAARQFLEAAWTDWKGHTAKIRPQWNMSPAVILSIRTLDFLGKDPSAEYELRGKGLSYFSLGPVSLFPDGAYVGVSDNWEMYEMTEEEKRLTLSDRTANLKTCEMTTSTPSTQMGTLCHLEVVADRLRFLFDNECKLAMYLTTLASKISTDPRLARWQSEDWLAFNWRVHVAMRRSFTNCLQGVDEADFHYMGAVQSDLTQGRRSDIRDCPMELQPGGGKKRSAAAAGIADEKPAEPDGPKKPAAKNSRPEPVGSPIADNFMSLLNKAREGAKNPKQFKMRKVFKQPSEYAEVFGAEFTALAEGGKPCGKFFFSKCGAPNCPFSHRLRKDPEKSVISGMVKRFQEKVDRFVAEQASKE